MLIHNKTLNLMGVDKCFIKNTLHKIDEYGYTISCKKGLWSVSSLDRKQALAEAKHYFIQYYEDGEYK